MKMNPLRKAIVRACTDREYRDRLLADPHRALAEEGLEVPASVRIVVHESAEDKIRVVLPSRQDAEMKDRSRVVLAGPVADVPAGLSLKWECQILIAEGRIDSNTAPALKRELLRSFQDTDLDLAKVTFLSSAGLSALLAGMKHLQENDASLRLLDVPEQIFNVIELAGFADMFEVVDRSELQGLPFTPAGQTPFLATGAGVPFPLA